MPKPKIELTFVASTARKTTKLARKLKQIADNHRARQEKLLKELQDKSNALAAKCQKQQHAAFEQLRVEMGISDADWGDGRDWALSIENPADGTVALVHATDERRAYDDDGCDCMACQIRRAWMPSGERDDPEKPAADPRRLH